MIEMMVHSLLDNGRYAVVVLKEVEGKRQLQIVVGPYEAKAISRHLVGVKEPRPVTHDLLKNVIEETGGEVRKITVTDLRGEVYYAVVSIGLNAEEFEIDARPSDAIALAVRCGAPIFVDENVIAEEARSRASEADDREEKEAVLDEKFREIVKGLEPEDDEV